MPGEIKIRRDAVGDWVQEALPGFEELLDRGIDVTVQPGAIRLTKTRERRRLELSAEPGRGA